MIKVTVVNRYLNVRVGEPLLSAPSFQYLAPGSEIEVDGKLYTGSPFENNNKWFKDGANNYYWSGGVSVPVDNPSIDGKTTFGWFNQLKIADVWKTYKVSGKDVKVAILDSGYAKDNPDLNGKIKADNTKVIIDSTMYQSSALVIDDRSKARHGTRCATLAGGLNGQGWVIGVAPACELLIAKTTTDDEFFDNNYLLTAIEWAIAKGAEVISASFGFDLTPDEATAFDLRIRSLIGERQVLLFAASGDTDGTAQSHNYYPACLSSFVSVGASTATGALSAFTTLNNQTIIHAPGENIESFGTGNAPSPATGTSFSTPIVAGVAALAIAYLKERDGHWDSATLLKKMDSSADPIEGHPSRRLINPGKFFQVL